MTEPLLWLRYMQAPMVVAVGTWAAALHMVAGAHMAVALHHMPAVATVHLAVVSWVQVMAMVVAEHQHMGVAATRPRLTGVVVQAVGTVATPMVAIALLAMVAAAAMVAMVLVVVAMVAAAGTGNRQVPTAGTELLAAMARVVMARAPMVVMALHRCVWCTWILYLMDNHD